MKKFLSFVLITLFVVSSFALKVVMVTDVGGLGDKSFNDGANIKSRKRASQY